MSQKNVVFQTDRVRRLQKQMLQISQDTNDLRYQIQKKANTWDRAVPMLAEMQDILREMNRLTEQAEHLEGVVSQTIQKVEKLQEENKRKINQWAQARSGLMSIIGYVNERAVFSYAKLPAGVKKVMDRFADTVANLFRDDLYSDPHVEELENKLKSNKLTDKERSDIEAKLEAIFDARDGIAKAQTAYQVYKKFGNIKLMKLAHKYAEEKRKQLKELGVDEKFYAEGTDLRTYFKESSVKACSYNPVKYNQEPLPEDAYSLMLLEVAVHGGTLSKWALKELQTPEPNPYTGYDHELENLIRKDMVKKKEREERELKEKLEKRATRFENHNTVDAKNLLNEVINREDYHSIDSQDFELMKEHIWDEHFGKTFGEEFRGKFDYLYSLVTMTNKNEENSLGKAEWAREELLDMYSEKQEFNAVTIAFASVLENNINAYNAVAAGAVANAGTKVVTRSNITTKVPDKSSVPTTPFKSVEGFGKSNEVAFMGREKQPFVSDLSNVTGKGAVARNKAIESVIKSDLSGIKFIHKPQYSPFVNTGVAMKDVGTHIGKKRFSSREDLINTIVHEELHHRWWSRGIPGYLHHSPDKYVPNERFYSVIERYMKMKGFGK